MTTHDTPFELGERYWSKVSVAGPDDCWGWQASRDGKGYGYFSLDGRIQAAHRLVAGLRRGDPGWALHRCNNPPCVNPAHIYVGDVRDNVRDRDNAGRGVTKVTEPDVREIRHFYAAEGVTQTELARRFGVSPRAIRKIVNRETWAWMS